jgi:hypothetical protein
MPQQAHDHFVQFIPGSSTIEFPVILAGKEIRKLNFGRADSPVLAMLRRVLRESRAIARKEGITTRVRKDLPTRRA